MAKIADVRSPLTRLGLLLFALTTFVSPVQAQYSLTNQPGQINFGRSNYIEYIVGDMPVIFSAPHGGSLTPTEIPDRTNYVNDPDFTTVTDSNTAELAQAVQTVFMSYFGHSPHVTICFLKRTKIDCNRTQYYGCGTNSNAIISWNDFQNFINVSSNYAIASSPRAFYIDLHGQGHAIQRLELGYLLTASQLTNTDAYLNSSILRQDSSILTLSGIVSNNLSIPFAQILRGTNSFGGLMASLGYPSVPSPTMPSPGNGTNPIVYPGDQNDYFDGGYNTAVHASQASGGPVDGLQIESNFTGVRDTAANRTNFAYALAQVMDYFFTNYYGIDLRQSAPSYWSGGGGYFSVANNWDLTLPVSGNYLYFRGSGGALSNNLAALSKPNRIYSLIFGTNATGSYTLYGNAMNLVAGITNLSSLPQTITNGITLLTNQTFSATGGPLVIACPITNQGFTLAVAGNSNLTLKASLTGSGGLTKSGAGTLIISTASTYSGATTNFSGLLLASNTTGSATGTGPLYINPSATLGGPGIIAGPVTVSGVISPGTTVGNLTLSNGLTFTGGNYNWSLAANATNFPGINFDQILLNGGPLAIDSNSTVTISFINSASVPATNNAFWQAAHVWKIISLAGGATNTAGAFGSVSNGNYGFGKFTTSTDVQGNVLFNYIPLVPPVLSPLITGAGTTSVSLSWSAVSGVNYQVLYATNLSQGVWYPLVTITASGTNASYLDNSPVAPQRFYRLVIP